MAVVVVVKTMRRTIATALSSSLSATEYVQTRRQVTGTQRDPVPYTCAHTSSIEAVSQPPHVQYTTPSCALLEELPSLPSLHTPPTPRHRTQRFFAANAFFFASAAALSAASCAAFWAASSAWCSAHTQKVADVVW